MASLDVISCPICMESDDLLILQMPNCDCTTWVASERHPNEFTGGAKKKGAKRSRSNTPTPPTFGNKYLDDAYKLTPVNSSFMCLSCTSTFKDTSSAVMNYDYNDPEENNPAYSCKLKCTTCSRPYGARTIKHLLKTADGSTAATHNRIIREAGLPLPSSSTTSPSIVLGRQESVPGELQAVYFSEM
eukprot:CAMPEP_0118663692 /NCGR_PEP_ID=MMETSP0785-20121206/17576_1 /TAXON_ID=91992 /ORGANISM="Bolidomonas pacifica, Strain CCMP 1866" /LENGTH=186 /DNA_ID=CAMNT_0006557471 /DNA_START=194 /DNA_END=751 /DNA_ORIENTATION=-